MIIAEYGHNNSQTITQNFTGFSPSKEKSNLSSFDLLLGDIGNSLNGNSLSKDISLQIPEDRQRESVDFSLEKKDNILHKADNSLYSIDKEEQNLEKESQNIKSTSIDKEKDMSTTDIKYMADINKKMNQLLDKLKNKAHLSATDLQAIAQDLKVLTQQMNTFLQHKGISPSEISNVEVTGSKSGQSPQEILNQLLKTLFDKSNTVKDTLKSMGLSQQSAAPIKAAELDNNTKQLKMLDQELDKTVGLLNQLKELNKVSKDLLNTHNIENKVNSSQNNDFQFHIDLKPINKEVKSLIAHSTKVDVQIANNLQALSASHTSHHNSGQDFGQEGQSHSGLNQFGVSGGIGKSQFLSTDGTLMKDASHMNLQDKMMLGKEILTQMQNQMKGFIGKNNSHFSISLKPEELGEIKVIMDMKNGEIKSQIIVENQIVKDVLKERFDDMKTMFAENGVNITGLDVKTQSEFEQEQTQSDKVQNLFESYQASTEQIKLNRHFENIQKTNLAYEKTVDNYNINKEFIITV